MLPRLSIGCGTITLAASQDAVEELIAAAIQQGPCHFDTAPLYANGESEARLGEILRDIPRSAYTLSTKTGRYPAPPGTGRGVIASRFDYSREGTRTSVAKSLDKLACSLLDLVFVHDLDEKQHGSDYPERREEALNGAFPALRELREDGALRRIGVASMEWRACLDLVENTSVDVVMLAGGATLLDRDSDPLFVACKERQIDIMVASPFNSGILATGAVPGARYRYVDAPQDVLDRVARMEKACKAYGVPLAAAALQYPGWRHSIASLVVGHTSVDEYRQNQAMLDIVIPDTLWQELEDL